MRKPLLRMKYNFKDTTKKKMGSVEKNIGIKISELKKEKSVRMRRERERHMKNQYN
jgi:hypothetical protein